MPVAVSTFSVTNFCASFCSSATRFSMAVRRALASLDSSSTRLLTTVVACERRAFGWNSKPLTDFCAAVSAFWASFWAASKRFCVLGDVLLDGLDRQVSGADAGVQAASGPRS